MDTRSAFIAIVGRPNVGKSSLLNSLLGEKVAIVTDKPQTTRTKITGVLTKDQAQFVFVDTPGLHTPKTKLSNSMVKAITSSIHDVDAAVLVVDATLRINQAEQDLIKSIKDSHMPSLLIINKIDLLPDKEKLVAKMAEWGALHDFNSIIPVSVLKNDGVDIVLKELDKFTEESVHFFPDDTLTDQPERIIVSEIIREKLLTNLSQEVPHGIAVVIEKMREREDRPLMDIEAIIYCEKKSHKGIIIGKSGALLKKVASEARVDIEAFLDIKVNLQCWVKVKEDWRNKEGSIRDFGLSEQ